MVGERDAGEEEDEEKKEKKAAAKESARTIARRMLEKGIEPSEVWSFIPNLSYKDIEELKDCK